MPIFEYSCPKCSTVVEIILSKPHNTPLCEECGMILERIISKSNFSLKGGGWAKDNYEQK